MKPTNDFSSQHAQMIAMPTQGLDGKLLTQQVYEERLENIEHALPWRQIARLDPPAVRPAIDVKVVFLEPAQDGTIALRFCVLVCRPMLLTRLLNACHHHPGFVYERARLRENTKTIEVEIRPRRGSKPICSGCYRSGRSYDHLSERRFEFIPVWGYAVILLYGMRRVDCRGCGVRVEALPWAIGKNTLTRAYMLFLPIGRENSPGERPPDPSTPAGIRYARLLSMWCSGGLANRQLGPYGQIGVDEIQYGRGHQYLTLVYQIESTCTRLLWVGKERTTESFQGFFRVIGAELASKIEFVCSDMWPPYLQLIKQHCSQALNILDRFHIVAKMNKALDEVRASEARQLVREGYEPVLKKTRWCLLKRTHNLTGLQRIRLRDLLRYTSGVCERTCSKRTSSISGATTPRPGRVSSWTSGARRPCAHESGR